MSSFTKNLANYPAGKLWTNPLGSFTILIKNCPLCAWATHWEFFQRIPINMITMCPVGSSQRTYNKLSMWFNFTINSQRTQWVYGWVHCDHIDGYSLKELSMSGSGIWWVHFGQNCERTQGVRSKITCWVICWVLFERTHNLPTDQSVIKVVSKF